MPTLTQLEYIIAVDTYRSFGTAAQRCFVTQPTLSMQIRKAEEELGVLLFDRSKQPVMPTDIGEIIIEQARVVLRENQRLHQLIDEFKDEVAGQLRMGIIPTLAPYLLPLFVGDLVRKYPKLQLQVHEYTSQEIIQALHNDKLDVGILVTPLHQPQIREMPLFYEEILIYLHPDHDFTHRPEVPIADLRGNDIWLLSEGHCFRNQMINLCALSDQQWMRLPFEYESSSLEALKRLVDREGGFTLLPELAIESDQRHHIRHLTPTPLREVSLVYIRNFAKWNVLKLLAQQIQQALPPTFLQQGRGQVVEWH